MAIPCFQDNLESVNALLIVFKQSLSKLGHFFFLISNLFLINTDLIDIIYLYTKIYASVDGI